MYQMPVYILGSQKADIVKIGNFIIGQHCCNKIANFYIVSLLGSQNVHWHLIHLIYGSMDGLMMTPSSQNMSL